MKYLLPFQSQEQNNLSSESYTYMLSLFAACAEALSNEPLDLLNIFLY